MIALVPLLSALAPSARAQEPACDLSGLSDPGAALSVAWISPLRARAGGNKWLYVIPTKDLRAFVAGEGQGNLVRTLQWAGVRKSTRPPSRRFKVVVFDVSAASLCRPVWPEAGDLADGRVAGVVPCDASRAGPHRRYEGCGVLTDLGTGQPSVPVYRAQWNALAGNGFCLLPLDRFVAGP